MTAKFELALENAAVAFVTYALSLISALSWNNAVQDFIASHKGGWWKRWAYAIGITILSLIIITVIIMFHDDDNRDSDDTRPSTLRQSVTRPRMGRIA
jgi:hypothetical protein